MRGHLRSCNEDAGHTIRSAIPENSMLHTNVMAPSFIKLKLRAIQVYIAGMGIFNSFGFVA